MMEERMTMRSATKMIWILGLLLFLVGCLGPVRGSVEEKRAAIDSMKAKTLEELYLQKASAREKIQRSAGYAVFSNVSAQALFLGGGGGYGVAQYQDTGQKVYMKMAQVGVGFGLGIQDVRVVFVFHTTAALDRFIYQGWDFGAQADAAAKSEEKGGAAGGEISITSDMEAYTLTESGLLAKINLAGTKYWQDKALNY
jgi:lipid-binding SYLF domain-containing protein